jgi:hypothetical protein
MQGLEEKLVTCSTELMNERTKAAERRSSSEEAADECRWLRTELEALVEERERMQKLHAKQDKQVKQLMSKSERDKEEAAAAKATTRKFQEALRGQLESNATQHERDISILAQMPASTPICSVFGSNLGSPSMGVRSVRSGHNTPPPAVATSCSQLSTYSQSKEPSVRMEFSASLAERIRNIPNVSGWTSDLVSVATVSEYGGAAVKPAGLSPSPLMADGPAAPREHPIQGTGLEAYDHTPTQGGRLGALSTNLSVSPARVVQFKGAPANYSFGVPPTARETPMSPRSGFGPSESDVHQYSMSSGLDGLRHFSQGLPMGAHSSSTQLPFPKPATRAVSPTRASAE